ncbi:substrate-binding periplasmic protein [Motilimonas eburnea]|uniref:substrate-binding periplasmic protein n=1 Tax=Motilimonas eburnea TaxID=1737488 RepID=UPI001E424954|nr:transporter substrate-binding domain-containing protein [Motilimonas eburnea]MCE2572904.1 transporter substrate-binding domain-containing protein [Motilimonas eburnea]
MNHRLMLASLLYLLYIHGSWAATLAVVTEEYAPYNYTQQDEIKGLASQIVEASLQRAGFDYHIKVLPWSRAYHLAKSNPNTLIYSISRTHQREPYFHWIGPIASIQSHFFSLKSRQDIAPFNQLKDARQYQVGSIRDDYIEQFLLLHGFTKLQRNNNHEANLDKLLRGRIDLWPVSTETASYYLGLRGLSLEQELKRVHTISEFSGTELYMAMGLDTPIATVEQLRQALNEIKQDGTYDKLIKQYFSQQERQQNINKTNN